MAAAASSAAEWAWMAEVAGEELAKLEAAHPGRFAPLKAELRRLIAEPAWDDAAAAAAAAFPAVSRHAGAGAASCSAPMRPACTQESSSRKRRRRGGGVVEQEEEESRVRRRSAAAASGGKDGAALAIERAERCLTRIRAVKLALLGSTSTVKD